MVGKKQTNSNVYGNEHADDGGGPYVEYLPLFRRSGREKPKALANRGYSATAAAETHGTFVAHGTARGGYKESGHAGAAPT